MTTLKRLRIVAILYLYLRTMTSQVNCIRVDHSKIQPFRTTTPRHLIQDIPMQASSRVATRIDFKAFTSKPIPMKPPRIDGNKFSEPSLNLEPDAEMLPAHYTRVEPPGVDHMELRRAESRISESNPDDGSSVTVDPPARSGKFNQAADAGYAERATDDGAEEQARKKVASFERASKGSLDKETAKTEFSVAAGKRRTHSDDEDDSGHRKVNVDEKDQAMHRVKGEREKGSKTAGFRNVYRKDEYKKDRGFYGNDRRGGHFKKHGRYKEKHASAEGGYRDGGNSGVKVGGKGTKEKAQASREARGHDSRQGYEGFFKNFQGFADPRLEG